MEISKCYDKIRDAGYTRSVSENLCNQQAHKINPNASAEQILCAIKLGNKFCMENQK